MSVSVLKTVRESLAVEVRHMQLLRDLPSVLDTESASARPWEESTLVRFFHRQDGIIKVAELPHRNYVVGHLSITIGDEVRIHKIAVKPGFRMQGVGERLLTEAINIGSHLKRAVHFPVREGDLSSQLWLRNRGWKCFRIGTDYHTDSATYWFGVRR